MSPPFAFAGKKYTDLDEFAPGMLDQPASKMVNIVAGPQPFAGGPPRGLLCDVAGTIDVLQVDGTTLPGVPVQPGLNRIIVAGITAFHNVTNIKGVY